MNDYNKLDTMLLEMKREILNLKTAHNMSPFVRTFYATIEPSSTQPITITYDDGDNDIITDVYTDADAVLGAVSSNTQKLYFSSQAPLEVTVVSTRPIISLVQ